MFLVGFVSIHWHVSVRVSGQGLYRESEQLFVAIHTTLIDQYWPRNFLSILKKRCKRIPTLPRSVEVTVKVPKGDFDGIEPSWGISIEGQKLHPDGPLSTRLHPHGVS